MISSVKPERRSYLANWVVVLTVIATTADELDRVWDTCGHVTDSQCYPNKQIVHIPEATSRAVEYVKVTHLEYSALDPRLIFIKKLTPYRIIWKFSLKQLIISPGLHWDRNCMRRWQWRHSGVFRPQPCPLTASSMVNWVRFSCDLCESIT